MHQMVEMWRHSTGMVAVFFIMVAVFGIALFLGSALVAFVTLLTGLVVAFVMATAWMRPDSNSTEHHPKIDRIFRDTAP